MGDETQEKGQNGSPFLAAGGAGKGEWGRLRVLFGPFVKKKKKKIISVLRKDLRIACLLVRFTS